MRLDLRPEKKPTSGFSWSRKVVVPNVLFGRSLGARQVTGIHDVWICLIVISGLSKGWSFSRHDPLFMAGKHWKAGLPSQRHMASKYEI